MRDRIVSTVFWTAEVMTGSCFARVSERVKREERVPVYDEGRDQSGGQLWFEP